LLDEIWLLRNQISLCQQVLLYSSTLGYAHLLAHKHWTWLKKVLEVRTVACTINIF